METIGECVRMYCPNCGVKITVEKRIDGAVRIECKRCGIKIFSRKITPKEISIIVKDDR